MEVKEYLKTIIEDKSQYTLTLEDKKIIEFEGIETYIFRKLNSSKYRATKTEKQYEKAVQEKVSYCVSNKLPLHILLPFGAVKNPNLPTYPGVDWAEAFNLAFIRNYLKPIASGYKHGVVLHYWSVAVFEKMVNNISIDETNLYNDQFKSLVEHYSKYLPGNFEIRFSRVEDEIPREIIEEELEKGIVELRENWMDQPKEIRDYKLLKAERNYVHKPDGKNKDEQILSSALGHDAFCSECWGVKPILWNEPGVITLGHRYTSGWAIHVRSCQGSTVNFWSGIGVLFKNAGKYQPSILSKKQFDKYDRKIDYVSIDYFKERIKGLNDLPLIVE